jgi:hypothetical protein
MLVPLLVLAILLAVLLYIVSPFRTTPAPSSTFSPTSLLSSLSPASVWRLPSPEVSSRDVAAYNPSGVAVDGGFLRSFRTSNFTRCPGSRSQYLFDNEPESLESETVLEMNGKYTRIEMGEERGALRLVRGYEDMRLFPWGEGIYGIVNTRVQRLLGRTRPFLLYICEKSTRELPPLLERRAHLFELPMMHPNGDAKNLSPFSWEGRLFLSYTLNPHVVVEVLRGELDELRREARGERGPRGNGEELREVWASTSKDIPVPERLRGGTRAILAPWGSYIAVGHVKVEDGSNPDYISYLYSFQARPPFSLDAISPPLKMVGKRVEFVSGIARIEGGFLLQFGLDDCAACEAILPEQMAHSLLHVKIMNGVRPYLTLYSL